MGRNKDRLARFYAEPEVKAYTPEQFAKINRKPLQARICAVHPATVDGKPAIALVFQKRNGNLFCLVLRHDPLSRQIADDLTKMLGKHPLVEEFYGLQ